MERLNPPSLDVANFRRERDMRVQRSKFCTRRSDANRSFILSATFQFVSGVWNVSERCQFGFIFESSSTLYPLFPRPYRPRAVRSTAFRRRVERVGESFFQRLSVIALT